MPNRTARMASAVSVSILASVVFATAASSETATEGCLSAPGNETPPGSHWRYHIDHINKRNCWYLRREDGLSQALPQTSPPSLPAPAKPSTSITDAHAELRSRPANEDSTLVSPPVKAAASDSANATVWGAAPLVATRWPDIPAPSPAPGAGTTAASPPSNAAPSTADSRQSIVPPMTFANFPMPAKPGTVAALIAAAVAALAFAGTAAVISRRGRSRRLRGRMARSVRGPIGETTDDDRIILSDHPYTDGRDFRPRFGHGARSPKADDRTPKFVPRAQRYARR